MRLELVNWSRYLWMCLACALLVVVGLIGGYLWAQTNMGKDLAKARSDARNCGFANTTQQAVIETLRSNASANDRALDAERAVAQAAMQARDKLQRKLTVQARQHQHDIEEAAHAHASCTGLQHQPVCPAVARELFDTADGDHTAAGGHGHP